MRRKVQIVGQLKCVIFRKCTNGDVYVAMDMLTYEDIIRENVRLDPLKTR